MIQTTFNRGRNWVTNLIKQTEYPITTEWINSELHEDKWSDLHWNRLLDLNEATNDKQIATNYDMFKYVDQPVWGRLQMMHWLGVYIRDSWVKNKNLVITYQT